MWCNMETWELTEYEQGRRHQEINMDAEMAVSPRSLHREIVCPVCLGILNQTRAAPDCLHRFCKKCLDKIIKKECPVCKRKLPAQVRSFREDPKFDQLIEKIFYGYHATRPLDINRTVQNGELEIVLRQLSGQQSRFLKSPENTTVDHLRKYLSIRPESTKLLNFDGDEDYRLCIVADRSKGQYKMLPGTLTLSDVIRTYNLSADRPLELYYYNPNKR